MGYRQRECVTLAVKFLTDLHCGGLRLVRLLYPMRFRFEMYEHLAKLGLLGKTNALTSRDIYQLAVAVHHITWQGEDWLD